MVDVLVDHTLIERALTTLGRYVYVGDLRMSQRTPIEELQRIVREATVERTVTDASVMVCSTCGYLTGACPECGDTHTESLSTVDQAAMAAARTAPAGLEATDCDSPEDQPDARCHCNRCGANRARQAEAAEVRRVERTRRRREESAVIGRTCSACGILFPTAEELAGHITGHANECAFCLYTPMADVDTMPEHLARMHPRCEQCGLQFRNGTAYFDHRPRCRGLADPIPREAFMTFAYTTATASTTT